MKKPLLILVAGFLIAGAAYASFYLARTAQTRSITASEKPELLWLKQEFGLEDEEFARIRELHEGYLPDCARMCARIAAANAELERLIVQTNAVTPEISAKLAEIGDIRRECQMRMLEHFYAVSRAMPEEQGRRYIAQMQKLTSLANMRHEAEPGHASHGH